MTLQLLAFSDVLSAVGSVLLALLIGGNDGNSSGGTSGSVFPD